MGLRLEYAKVVDFNICRCWCLMRLEVSDDTHPSFCEEILLLSYVQHPFILESPQVCRLRGGTVASLKSQEKLSPYFDLEYSTVEAV